MMQIKAFLKDHAGHNVWVVYAADRVLGADTIVPTVVKTPTFNTKAEFRARQLLLDRDLARVVLGPRRPSRRRKRPPDWFIIAVFMIPRDIREPWSGDLREDRVAMARMGMPRWQIELSTGCQLTRARGPASLGSCCHRRAHRQAPGVKNRRQLIKNAAPAG